MIDTPTETPKVKLPVANLRNIALSIALGIAGGWVFYSLSLPLPWMLGAMAATCVAAVLGLPMVISKYLRHIMIAVIGVLLGSAFTPALTSQILQWTLSLTVLAIFLLMLAIIIPWCLQRAGYDRPTAFFSALPAGLTEMTAVGSENGGNPHIIALTHTVRILIVAFTIPFLMVLFAGYERPETLTVATFEISTVDIAMLTACAVVGLWLGIRFRFPAGSLAGPLALSAVVHVSGLTASSPPDSLVAIAQVVLGTSVGSRFTGLTIATMKKTLALAVAVTLGMLALSGTGAVLLAPVLEIHPMALMLALTPGGVTEMSLMALALNQDIAFVTTHHLVRIGLIVMIAPVTFAAYQRLHGDKN
ncbi:MAG: AbrB family transcriptional regulator [Rhodospirillaceae bacterium]